MSDLQQPTKRRVVHAEAILQTRLKMWVREAVLSPHKFFAFDRSRPSGKWTHAREKARGVLKATPDTLLFVPKDICWAELKDPRIPNLNDQRFAARWPDQWQMGQELLALGHSWYWFQKIFAYYEWLECNGVELAPNARFLAVMADAMVESLIAGAEMKKGVLPKRLRAARPRPTVAQVTRAERARFLP